MSVRENVSLRKNLIQFLTCSKHVWAEKCVTEGKIAFNFPLVTQFWEICVTQGMSRNLTDIPWVAHFPLVTHFFRAKKCVTQGMSTVFKLHYVVYSNGIVIICIYALFSYFIFSCAKLYCHAFFVLDFKRWLGAGVFGYQFNGYVFKPCLNVSFKNIFLRSFDKGQANSRDLNRTFVT